MSVSAPCSQAAPTADPTRLPTYVERHRYVTETRQCGPRSLSWSNPMMPSATAVLHAFHIPVMGTGFTIDTPLRVARWGIASAISLVDDDLIERVRVHHAARLGLDAQPIGAREPDARARRITAYLDLLHHEVTRQIEEVRQAPFVPDSPISRYFSLLPDGPLRRAFQALPGLTGTERQEAERRLREAVSPGAIESNIMTKIDRRVDARGAPRPDDRSDALAALRGFAASRGPGALVLSAGLNPRLCALAAKLDAFFPREGEPAPKRIVVKVSDYRSALVQGKYLAKRGLWVSEYRIESGLNCGGHAFATAGLLMGPILQQFQDERAALVERAFAAYAGALAEAGRFVPQAPPPLRITAQGGLGSADEAALLHDVYGVDGTGWGSPFLLVPEVTRVDADTRARLLAAQPDEIVRGASSPLGVPFWSLTTSASERARRERIARQRPGSPCPKGYLALQTAEDGTPICPASRAYQRRTDPPHPEAGIDLRKACICHDLSGGAMLELGLAESATPAICPGPNVTSFRREMSLRDMVDHVYGRKPLALRRDRPHVLIAELNLYVDELADRWQRLGDDAPAREQKALATFFTNLLTAIEHYRQIVPHLPAPSRPAFEAGLHDAHARLVELADPEARRASA